MRIARPGNIRRRNKSNQTGPNSRSHGEALRDQPSDYNYAGDRRELRQLERVQSLDAISLCERLQQGATTTSNWTRCTCPVAELDTRVRMRANMHMQTAPCYAPLFQPKCKKEGVPSAASQANQFGAKMSRKKLLKQLGLSQVWRRANSRLRSLQMEADLVSQQATASYELERLSREANAHLSETLLQLARCDLNVWMLLVESKDLLEEEAAHLHVSHRESTISRPLGIRLVAKRSHKLEQMLPYSSDDSGMLSWSNEAEFGSSADEEAAPDSKTIDGEVSNRALSLEKYFELRACTQFNQIIVNSCKVFDQILSDNQLLRLQLEPSSCDSSRASSLNQLRLFACVECQKVRAILRFDWLAKCLWLAFDSLEVACKKEDNSWLPKLVESNSDKKSIRGRQTDEEQYVHALNKLVGRLLRDHFLERALDTWLQTIERQLTSTTSDELSIKPVLSVPVELQINPDGQLVASKPDSAVEQALEFVASELVAITCDLPQIGSDECDGSCNHIVVLPPGDDMLQAKQNQLARLIQSAHVTRQGWISRDYLKMITIINKFRASASLSAEDLDLFKLDTNDFDESEISNSKVKQMSETCRQIGILERLELALRCELECHFDFGRLVRLDCSPLNKQLLKIVESERSLLIRLHADNIWKLMEGLRLQLDELELNIDLESALEDYLSKRWQIKQSQQPNLEQQILLDDNLEAGGEFDEQQFGLMTSEEAGQVEGPMGGEEACMVDNRQVSLVDEEEEEFANALVGNNNSNVAHLFALSNPNGIPLGEMEASGELGVGSRGLAPLVECRLLLARYEYLNNFVTNDLNPFLDDVDFLMHFGLTFLTERLPTLAQVGGQDRLFLKQQHLEPMQLELIGELVARTRSFGLMLEDSLQRLEMARNKFHRSSKLRALVLSRICLEFDWLMRQLASKRLNQLRGTLDELKANTSSIKHLDLIQETASWAQKLDQRRAFLAKQNELLDKEARFLHSCDQFKFLPLPSELRNLEAYDVRHIDSQLELPDSVAHELELRRDLVGRWARFASLAGAFWRLVEEFETQQVKWINSEAKKLDYEQVKSTFERKFESALVNLEQQIDKPEDDDFLVLRENLNELRESFGVFSQKFLPIFKFLTNTHLTQEHWLKLLELVDRRTSDGLHIDLSQLQQCNTVAQLLEWNVQQFVGQLDEMSHQATIEHELAMLILAETDRMKRLHPTTKCQLASLEVCARLDEWNEPELAQAAARFISLKLEVARRANDGSQLIEAPSSHATDRLAKQLVACHILVRRYLKLCGHLNLMTTCLSLNPKRVGKSEAIVLRTGSLLSTAQQVRASLLLEFLRLFTQTWIESSARIGLKLSRASQRLDNVERHLSEIDELLERVQCLTERDLQLVSRGNEQQLADLQRDSIKLELEREILATREAQTLESQRAALRARDTCVSQVCERAIPAIRAATRALDCLGEGRSLRALRSYRPRPPLAIRLVIEAVCLLRNACCSSESFKISGADPKGQLKPTTGSQYPVSPERHFDALRGQIVSDYWPVAWRTLNGLHSSRFIGDLRLVSKRTIPRETILIIRRKYLSRPEFHLATIERISPESGLLARWLVAVDVFDRVINIVRPNYEAYLRSEQDLAELLVEVSHKRQEIHTIGGRLEHIKELIERQVSKQAALVDLLADCSQQSSHLKATRAELEAKRFEFLISISRLKRQMQRLAHRCLWKTARLVYLDALVEDERQPLERLLRHFIIQLEFN